MDKRMDKRASPTGTSGTIIECLDALVTALLTCEHRIVENPYFER